MTAKLLVSVRSVAEAETCIRAGVEIIDIKEPNHGGLGAAEPVIWRDVAAMLPAETQGSVAMGELSERQEKKLTSDEYDSLTGIDYAKVGLANAGGDWKKNWLVWRQSLPGHVQPVAVAYADWKTAKSPRPAEVFAATAGEAPVLLIDTFDKTGRRLNVADEELKAIANRCRIELRRFAIAGRLTLPMIAAGIETLDPDIVAVRSAACGGNRMDEINYLRVMRLRSIVETPAERAKYLSA